MRKLISFMGVMVLFCGLMPAGAYATPLEDALASNAVPYVKYFQDRVTSPSAATIGGLTRSFQINLGGHSTDETALINYGAVSYDQSIIGRIQIAAGTYSILNTYITYFRQLADVNNPLFNTNGNYQDASNQPLKNGLYRIVRIGGRDLPVWWNTWDWIVDTGAVGVWIIDSLDAYRKTSNAEYRDFAIVLGEYILKLQDTDGGIRYGPRKMYHYPVNDNYYWYLKSTEQNERAFYAFEALYTITADVKYRVAADKIKVWLKTMYDSSVHLYQSAATFNGSAWVPSGFGYVATDVMAYAPIEMMFTDSYFGATQDARDAEIDAMFAALETRTAFLDGEGKPKLFKFSVSQTGEYGSVEWSAQMALAYLRVAQKYSQRGNAAKRDVYLDKYNALINNLAAYFFIPADDASAKVAPYASYLDGRVAGHVPTGTGYSTLNCQAALASVYYAFAKAGYDPTVLGGGPGVPLSGITLNLADVPWYENISFWSTGAGSAQMVINYMRGGVGLSELAQDAIYRYAKMPLPLGAELTPTEIQKALGHFDPYDEIVSNWADRYDFDDAGNPYQGYNFDVDVYDPVTDINALNKYMRDICHWMAYTVTKEDWWRNGELVARPNTPAVVPLFGTYNRWAVVKGFAASAHPCPEPRGNPFNTPDFTVYGFWIKDPRTAGIGQDTYKTAAECAATYFLPLNSTDAYRGKYLQIAEPPLRLSNAQVKIIKPSQDVANLEFMNVTVSAPLAASAARLKSSSLLVASLAVKSPKKKGWREVLETRLLQDPEVVQAFEGTKAGSATFVKRSKVAGSDYYLLPFGAYSRKGVFLVSGVVIIDAQDGHFKEASWTKKPQRFLLVGKKEAVKLIREHLVKEFYAELRARKSTSSGYILFMKKLITKYQKLFHYLDYASVDFVWGQGVYSESPYKPFLQVNANGHIWIVTQEGKVSSLAR